MCAYICVHMRVIIPLMMGIHSVFFFKALKNKMKQERKFLLVQQQIYVCIYCFSSLIRIRMRRLACVEVFVMLVENGNDDGINKVRNLLHSIGSKQNTAQYQRWFFFSATWHKWILPISFIHALCIAVCFIFSPCPSLYLLYSCLQTKNTFECSHDVYTQTHTRVYEFNWC